MRVWNTHAPGSSYPEDESVGPEPPRTGVCFSGGSTRSYAATVGQLRGLTQLGLIPRVTYMSAVSGGAWAAAAYAFYRGSARDDTQILGEATAPGDLTLERSGSARAAAACIRRDTSFSHILHAARADRSIRPRRRVEPHHRSHVSRAVRSVRSRPARPASRSMMPVARTSIEGGIRRRSASSRPILYGPRATVPTCSCTPP